MTRSTRAAPAQRATLARLGFTDPDRAERLLAEDALDGLIDPLDDMFGDGLVAAIAACPDPDRALLGLVRLLESLRQLPQTEPSHARAATSPVAQLRAMLRTAGRGRERLVAVLSGSQALTDHLIRHPEHWVVLGATGDGDYTPPSELADHSAAIRAVLLRAVGADPTAFAPVASWPAGRPAQAEQAAGDRLRIAYRRELLAIAGRDLTAEDPLAIVDEVATRLADLAAAALEAALAIARASVPGHGAGTRLAVLGMGKCGGRELNYVSDVDVIYVVEPDEGAEESDALRTGATLAGALARICSAKTPEGTLWPVDANLRPEGKDGPLVRTVESHVAYYARWAQAWEFQALLKARVVAGDCELGQRYVDEVIPMVWEVSARENFVEGAQAMRRRVEDSIPAKDAERQLKLGAGGLRDVEFSVQLLQLVHGRADDALRLRGTWESLAALAEGGYVGRTDAATLDESYRFLRVLEHRIQLDRLQRTHVLPTGADQLRRLARGVGLPDAEALEARWKTTRSTVRQLQGNIFYRPLLAAAAQLTTEDARLTPQAAQERLAALGYRDPVGAMRHIEALTAGVTRRAAIQRQLLPVLLGWFAEGISPDDGLLAFRRLSESLGQTHWYLKMLRDTGAAAQRLTAVLSSSTLVVDLLNHSREATRWFGDDDALAPRPVQALLTEVDALVRRRPASEEAAYLARHYRGRELLRTAIADLTHLTDWQEVGAGISAATSAALHGSLLAAQGLVAVDRGLGMFPDDLPVRVAVIAMGSFGGSSMGYTSDADVLFVYREAPGARVSAEEASAVAMSVVTTLQRLLKTPAAASPPVDISADLRPEGRSGPLVRSLDSFAEYYRRWALVWERQALLRAVPVAGDATLGEDFITMVDPLRYPAAGLREEDAREIRRLKARMEGERLPRGVSPNRHLKLGRGGLTDVEWVVQLLQLRHAGEHSQLRTPQTANALSALGQLELLAPEQVTALLEALAHTIRLRNALALWSGRDGDVLPTERRDLVAAARLMGYGPGRSTALEEGHLRVTRRARAVLEHVFA